MSYEELVKAAMGVVPFDLLIENRQLVDVYTYEIYQAAFGMVRNSCMPFGELRSNSELEKLRIP